VVTRSAEEILEFVMGVDSYHRADHKIGRVRSLRRDGEDVIVVLGASDPGSQRGSNCAAVGDRRRQNLLSAHLFGIPL
jgi:hypothetical protein